MTTNKKFEGVGTDRAADKEVPNITDEQIREAKRIEIENSRRIIQEHEADIQKRKQDCFQEIAAVCAKFGFQLSCEVSKPEVTVSLLPIH